MQALLASLGIARSDVRQLSAPAPHGRERLVSEALRPAATTERWQSRAQAQRISNKPPRRRSPRSRMIEAANAEEEALAIAVALREAVETPDKTAALVTPDRALARRVVAALERWHVPVDDSGGDSLADTQAGVFARLAAEAALGGLEPVTLLALLKHPLLRLGAGCGRARCTPSPRSNARCCADRGRAPAASGLAHALATFRANRDQLHRSDPRWLIDDDRARRRRRLDRAPRRRAGAARSAEIRQSSARRRSPMPPRRHRALG